MEFESKYEVLRVVTFIRTHGFKRVALQFPDELLKESIGVVWALRKELQSCGESGNNIALYVMADTTYGSCCVDEVGALHINADCVIHYGHTCLSPTSKLPAFFVFGKAPINASNCAKHLCNYALSSKKPVLVLFGLEYGHAIHDIIEASTIETTHDKLHFADVMSQSMKPTKTSDVNGDCDDASQKTYSIGGLRWSLEQGLSMEDYSLFWIGPDNSAFANVVLTFNDCEIVRYDATENVLLSDTSQQRRILKRRYYLVEKAKDAGIVGILVGTLGVAGYLSMIHQIKEMVTKAGKKAYTFVMGKPNPSKLANFPECDVFIYISCSQTALLDSKEFLAPVITPFEAILAFNRGSEWTGKYVMQFQDLVASTPVGVEKSGEEEEARFSFLQGGYIEDHDLQDINKEDEDGPLALMKMTQTALQERGKDHKTMVKKGSTKSGVDFFASRAFQGLDINNNSNAPEPFILGRSGKASGYNHETSEH
ncbi:putative diphthamide synthesis DPH1/DPH2 [Helianthus annuus]|uniref:2-(3-amino-3-carboxypropyl)histidine synthase subunit 2 n=1 Tax=Helianthus annuus TaxID=4232 RepID=A0A251VJG4_HELAN|nr:2-(3-amino-3-carboxypropyl)histidine synthase subunit 2 [Helianthus annuus]KAF5767925.1 putative diphthamide synthesis DPH1/DPH2 [Helianthus annuus]KAJ0839248.1 putative diphthamide synthesis DPH1/DPH2 [Helianthus annuus]